MIRDEIIALLDAVERITNERTTVVRVIVDEHGRETGQRIYRSAFTRPRDPQTRASHSQER